MYELQICNERIIEACLQCANSMYYKSDQREVVVKIMGFSRKNILDIESFDLQLTIGTGNSDDCEGLSRLVFFILNAYKFIGNRSNNTLLKNIACIRSLFCTLQVLGSTRGERLEEVTESTKDVKRLYPEIGTLADTCNNYGGHAWAIDIPLAVIPYWCEATENEGPSKTVVELKKEIIDNSALKKYMAKYRSSWITDKRDMDVNGFRHWEVNLPVGIIEGTAPMRPYQLSNVWYSTTFSSKSDESGRSYFQRLREFEYKVYKSVLESNPGVFRNQGLDPRISLFDQTSDHISRRISDFYRTAIVWVSRDLNEINRNVKFGFFMSKSSSGAFLFGCNFEDIVHSKVHVRIGSSAVGLNNACTEQWIAASKWIKSHHPIIDPSSIVQNEDIKDMCIISELEFQNVVEMADYLSSKIFKQGITADMIENTIQNIPENMKAGRKNPEDIEIMSFPVEKRPGYFVDITTVVSSIPQKRDDTNTNLRGRLIRDFSTFESIDGHKLHSINFIVSQLTPLSEYRFIFRMNMAAL